MKRISALVMVLLMANVASATITSIDTFGTGANQFTIDFVSIAGDAGDLGSWSAGSGYTFSGVNHGGYRIGTYEITNDQWNKFQASYGTVTGSLSGAYDESPYWVGTDVPTNKVSWYEAAQFVNYLNTSTGHQAAYKFTGTQGTGDYTFDIWSTAEATNGTNLYRHKDAYYFLPTEDEWVKAAYWNGTSLQTYATTDGSMPTVGVDTNYGYDYGAGQPWNVGNGSEELNGTFDMMGNISERIESPYNSGDYGTDSFRVLRGGSYGDLGTIAGYLASSDRFFEDYMPSEKMAIGFRVASVPEPATLLLFSAGAIFLRKRRK